VHTDAEICSPEEAAYYQAKNRQIGYKNLFESEILAGKITAKKLLTAFGMQAPTHLLGDDDRAYYNVLLVVMRREANKRIRIPEIHSVKHAVKLIKRSQNIVVLTGAGVCILNSD
jgi:NAD+-dependent protein deacetylase SIR2